ncbi:hypothetical protein L6164_029258 [Bauhinia variegata]|uniref:Uncharacterized protein n=1 Tax=Bauhinia variegata TaxID=167791 RepID=A0ACB9L914_BAUVA|nr:hypothetical protein L6164_029258 [Bauhinia variegata]
MEESGELHSEENKVSGEKNKKRRLKTPAQVTALEKFYNEHKYPTEEMKLELAGELGLTEKQVSGWFCHRRLKDKRLLKDEAYANGRQEHSSGVIQDRGSGLGQDSCGSTKHGDYRLLDPKEVESRGLYSHDFSAADLTYEHRNRYTENVSGMDDTSSESGSSLQYKSFSQGQDPYNLEPSTYLTPNRAMPPLNPKSATNMGYKPSGYLKVRGEIDAITSVKKQIGRNYREDGPPLSVEFDPLPPGAFEDGTEGPIQEPYYSANPTIPSSPEISPVKRQLSLSSRYDSYNTKFSPQDLHMEGAELGSFHDYDFQDKRSHQHVKQRPTFHSHANPLPGRKSSLDLYEDSTGEASAHNSKKNHRMVAKHGTEGMRSDSASNHSDHYEGKVDVKQANSLSHGYETINPKNTQRSEFVKSKPSNSKRMPHVSVDSEERGLSIMTAKGPKLNGDQKGRIKYQDLDRVRMLPNETMGGEQVMVDEPLQHNVKQAPVAGMQPLRNRRSALEMPSSFSEDETAETSSSLN